MIVVYNGITIECSTVNDYDREVVYDDTGNDALFVLHSLSVTGVLNGQVACTGHYLMSFQQADVLDGRDVNQYRPPQNALPPGLTRAPNRPALTDKAILEALTTPRRKLMLFGYHPDDITKFDVILESPLPGQGVDAKDGPTPMRCSVQEQLGADVTWMINFQIRTCTPVCASAAALLSNRFAQRHSVNQDHQLTIETTGTAVFRRDALFSGNPPINPDQLRQFLAVPIPPGFRRSNIDIWHDGDESALHYATTDEQEAYTFVGGREVKATQIHTNFTQALTTPGDKLESVLGAFERSWNLKWLKNAADAEKEKDKGNGGQGKAGRRGPPPRRPRR